MRPLASAALLCTACASASTPGTPAAPRTYVAATLQTIVTSIEESNGSTWAGLVYVENRSSVPITVTSVTLRNCENIKQQCGVNPMRRSVDPDSRTMVLRIEEKLAGQGHGYSYGVAWQADSTAAVALNVMADNGSKEAAERLTAAKHASEIRQLEVGVNDLELYPEDIARMGDSIVTLRPAADTALIPMGKMLYIQQLRVLAIGATGNVLGRYRGLYQFRVQPGAVRFAPPDSLIAMTPGRSKFELTPSIVPGSRRTKSLAPIAVTLVVK